MVYIVENNGCYGLTKGQFSATNDKASKSKKGEANLYDPIDLCQMAIQLGAGFVARSFSGDKAQLVPLIEAAMAYNGFAFIDVVSPCVTFNNHAASTKSFDYVRDHNQAIGKLDFVPHKEEIAVDYKAGEGLSVTMHDGALLRLQKLAEDYDPTSSDAALNAIRKGNAKGQVVTGLLYIDKDEQDLHNLIATDKRPLNELPFAELCPGAAKLDALNAGYR
jgi:2-oxoglutarate ferredoxin oxidoreductase subunit beta